MYSTSFTGDDGGSFQRFDRKAIDDLGDEIAEVACRIDAAQHRLLTLIRDFDERKGWGTQGAMSCAHWLSWRLGLDSVTAREKVRVARALGRLPLVDEAYRQGKLSYSKIRAISRVATPENESVLVHYGFNATGSQLEKICRSYRRVMEPRDDGFMPYEERDRYVRSISGAFGMVRIEALLTADEAAVVLKALDGIRFTGNQEAWKRERQQKRLEKQQQQQEKKHEQHERDLDGSSRTARATSFDRADALVALAHSVLEAGAVQAPSSSARFEVVMTVDAATLRGESEALATLDNGAGIPTEMARRIACDAALVEMEVDDQGDVLDVGRRRRTIPPSIRRALRRRDRGCRFPGCQHDQFVDGHHIVHWADGGETNMQNLVLLCRHHHRLVHEEGFTVEMAGEGPIFRRPDGVDIEKVGKRPGLSLESLKVQGFLKWLDETGVSHDIEGYPLPDYLGWDLGLCIQILWQADSKRKEALPN